MIAGERFMDERYTSCGLPRLSQRFIDEGCGKIGMGSENALDEHERVYKEENGLIELTVHYICKRSISLKAQQILEGTMQLTSAMVEECSHHVALTYEFLELAAGRTKSAPSLILLSDMPRVVREDADRLITYAQSGTSPKLFLIYNRDPLLAEIIRKVIDVHDIKNHGREMLDIGRDASPLRNIRSILRSTGEGMSSFIYQLLRNQVEIYRLEDSL